MNQQDHDQRSLAWHRHVIARMRSNGALLEKAWATLERWTARGPMPNRGYLSEWRAAMDAGLDAVDHLATAEGEHANALRQCSPISGILSNKERWAFRANWSQQHATRRP